MSYHHHFHIPVMGTGHSADTPIRVAPLGISSVISIVDDRLLERLRKYYLLASGRSYKKIRDTDGDGRASRITAYLDMVHDMVHEKLDAIKQQSIFDNLEKREYFELLPDSSILKKAYLQLMSISSAEQRSRIETDLTRQMVPGSIDVNIMVKVDKMNYNPAGEELPPEFTDGKAALRGYANSKLNSSIVFSAGINQSLFSYMSQFKDFYRDKSGEIKKKIVLKVNEYRSASIQGKFLARLGLEVAEYRVESGLNCGGHAFGSSGRILPSLLAEFKEKKDRLSTDFCNMIQRYYEKMNWYLSAPVEKLSPRITVQGGIGTYGEHQRLTEEFGMDMTGWASPFLLVPEVTGVDQETRDRLAAASADDLYLSEVSPLGISFNNLRNSRSEQKTKACIQSNRPGSPCPKGYLRSNTEFTEKPICTASTEYMELKLHQITNLEVPETEKELHREAVLAKTCLCDHLGDGLLLDLGIKPERSAATAVCPGPNIEWFGREYSLREMVDHIYGRGKSLVSKIRPHMFAKEIEMYVDYIDRQIRSSELTEKTVSVFQKFRENLQEGIDRCRKIAASNAFQNENLQSISDAVTKQTRRLADIYSQMEQKLTRR